MDWRLLDYAKEAEDTAAGLHVFLSEVPQYGKDITGQIAELFAISNALRTLNEALELSRYGRWQGRILRDLEIALPSLGHTLDDVGEMFSKSKRQSKQHPGAFPGTPQYTVIWEDALADFKKEGLTLPMRLEYYRTFLQRLHDILKGEPRDEEIDDIRAHLKTLLKRQEPIVKVVHQDPLDIHFSGLNIGDPRAHGSRTPRPKSPKPRRPKAHQHQTYPNYDQPAPPPPPNHYAQPHVYVQPIPPPPPAPPVPPQYVYPVHLPHSPMYGEPVYGEIPHVPPPVPSVPHSPTSTASSQTFSTHSNDSNSGAYWATKIFDGRHTQTPFQILGQPTKCLGRDEPQAIELLDNDGFQKVLEVPFEATNVWVRLYWRPDDKRARVLFLTLDPTGRRMRYCFPLTGLKVLRTESCLQLCRVNREDGQLDLWANLRFTMYERMVLFYCTLVAMKRQDEYPTPPGLDDFFQPGEKQEYGGEIQDNSSLHAFRIFRDKDSGGVRFEATARRGPLKTVPIWTAFVTQYIGHRGWMKRVGHATVQFRELHPYVFHQGYGLPRDKKGRFQITFSLPQDATTFMEVFHGIKVR